MNINLVTAHQLAFELWCGVKVWTRFSDEQVSGGFILMPMYPYSEGEIVSEDDARALVETGDCKNAEAAKAILKELDDIRSSF